MKLEGIHHITAITGDAPRNVDFYARVLGLRLVKKTVNQDDPTVYHLFYADEDGSAGVGPDVLRVPERARRAARARGWCTGSSTASARADSLDFWADRLGSEGVETSRVDGGLRFADPEGLEHELRVVETPDEPLHRALDARCRRSTRCRASTPSTRTVADPRRSAALLTEVMGVRGPRRAASSRRAAASRGGSIVLEPGERAQLRRRGHRAPHRVGVEIDEHEAWR